MILVAVLFFFGGGIAAEGSALVYKDKDISIRFIEFTPEQIAAFYHGREFDIAAINKLTQSCFVTVIIKNRSKDYLWIDLDQWQFSRADKIFQRQTRAYWNLQWDKIALKQSHRATFGWTLMPTVRNLYPDEGVGGRIPIPRQSEAFTLTLNFPTGQNKQGKVKSVIMKNMRCKVDNTSERTIKK